MRQVRNETLSDRIGHLAVEVLSPTAFEPKRSFGGSDGARTMMLVYDLPATDAIYQRFVGIEGSAYFV